MFVSYVIVFVFSVVINASGDINISEDEYAVLPPIFSIDPYEKCMTENKIFCRSCLKLKPLDPENPSKIWKLIEETKKSKRHYNHDELFHAICINDSFNLDNTSLSEIVTNIYTEKLRSKGLNLTISDLDCTSFKYDATTFDIIWLTVIIFYSFVIIFATCYHIFTKNREGNPYVILFSIYHNFKKCIKTYHNDDFGKLRCIQGVRFYTTVWIIFCHTFNSFAGGYINNTKYLEDIPLNFIRHSIRNLFLFLVQTFFLISGWLLSYQTFTVFQRNRNISVVKYSIITSINRYLRIIPPVLTTVCLASSVWIFRFFSGPVKESYSDKEYQRCRQNGWITLLFLNNHYRHHELCYFTSWYLSADTQLYVLSLILLSIAMKTKKHKMVFFIACFVLSIIIQSLITYWYDLDIIFRLTPENTKNFPFLIWEFNAGYTSTYVNMASYFLGLIFGYIYFRLEDKPVFTSNASVIFWWISTIGLPLTAIIVCNYEYSKVTSIILAGVVRPMYSLGFGIGIFGMSQKIGGFLKRIFEWKPAIFLGNFTYCTYVGHLAIVFSRTALTTKPVFISDYVLLTASVQDTLLSFICGFFLHLLLEMPATQLQNMLVFKYSVRKIKSDHKIK